MNLTGLEREGVIMASDPPPEYTCTELATIKFANQQLAQEIAGREVKVTICVRKEAKRGAGRGLPRDVRG